MRTIIDLIEWFPVDTLPAGDLFDCHLVIEEPNPNYEVEKQKGIPNTSPTRKYVATGIYVWSTQQFMCAGNVVTPLVKYWAVVNLPPVERIRNGSEIFL
jgi:hypothetical protein